MTIDRHADGYEPDFDIDSAVGRQGELFITSILTALSDGSVEVKTDEKAAVTGNVYVEWSCLRRGSWRPSGIASTKADLWAFVVADKVAVIAPTSVVREAARSAYRSGMRTSCDRGSHPTQGVLLPVRQLVQRLIAAGNDRRAA